MRSLLVTAVVVSAAIALGGCPRKRPHYVPGPQSAPAAFVEDAVRECFGDHAFVVVVNDQHIQAREAGLDAADERLLQGS